MTALFVLILAAFMFALVHAVVLAGWRTRLSADPPNPVSARAGQELFVSLVVPARNAGTTLLPLLQDLYAQHYPKDRCEVLVVDDHSTDDTAALVGSLQSTWPQLRLVSLSGSKGKKNAITAGVMEARGALILLTDDDGRCGPDRVPLLVDHWQRTQAELVLLPVFTQCGGAGLGVLQYCEQLALQAATLGSALDGAPVLANGANLAVARKSFFAVGGFQGDRWASGDDQFLLQRMRRADRKVSCLAHPLATVYVEPETSWHGFVSQRLRWAGKMRAYRDPWGLLAAVFAVLFPLGLIALALGAAQLTVGQAMAHSWMLLGATGLLWVVPVVQLVRTMERFFLAGSIVPGLPRPALTAMRTLLSLFAFMFYAPVIAFLSIFVRPTWKGRRI